MLEQLSKHSMFDIKVTANGDLHNDFHHTTEDSALALGEAFSKSLGDRKGISRFGQEHFQQWTKLFLVLLLIVQIDLPLQGKLPSLSQSLVKWTQNFLKNGFKRSLKQQA